MSFFARIRALIARTIERNIDLAVLWMGLLLLQHFIPISNPLARPDLQPWTAVALSAVAVLRGRPLGAGPHPRLTKRIAMMSRYFYTALLAIVPWTLLFLHDAVVSFEGGNIESLGPIGLVGGLLVAMAILLAFSRGYLRTAWSPGRSWPSVFVWLFVGGSIGVVVVAAGLLRYFLGELDWVRATAVATVLGASFVAVGLIGGRAQHHRQRVHAGRKDGMPHRRTIFPTFLAAFGPSIGLFVLYLVLPDLDFNFAFVVSLLVIVWGAVIWPVQDPVAVACLLHEVDPVGGRDKAVANTAKPFERPPDGALRFNPLRTKRTRVAHVWYVPVQASRIADLDDPIRPLWPEPLESPQHHVLGDARFEPDPLTKGPQWDVLTIRLKSQEDTTSLRKTSDAKTRRMVILRPYPLGFLWRRSGLRTYAWDQRVPEESLQVLDASTQTATLKDGDILVLSSEGVAHAYEFEIGGPIYWTKESLGARPPQLPDYVQA